MSSLYPGAEEGTHIKGRKLELGREDRKEKSCAETRAKEGRPPKHARNASCKNETSPTFLGNEAAAGQAAGLVHRTGTGGTQGLQEDRAALPAGQGGCEWGSGQEWVQNVHGVRWHEPHSTSEVTGERIYRQTALAGIWSHCQLSISETKLIWLQ